MLVIINGFSGSGKDTFVGIVHDLLQDEKTKIRNVHTSDPFKVALETLGWNGEKTPVVRNLLAEMKQVCNAEFNTTIKFVDRIVSQSTANEILFLHVREPEEIDYFKKKYDAMTLYIKRDVELDPAITNESDKNVEDYKYTCTIDNNGSLENLKQKAAAWIEQLVNTNLCTTCVNRKKFPHCYSRGIQIHTVLGIGRGFDNVVICGGYV